MSFQKQVNIHPAPGVAGDFCSANPRASVLNGPGDPVTGAAGVAVGLFAWLVPQGSLDQVSGEIDGFAIANNFGPGVPTGFVHREQQGLITAFLAESSQIVPPGLPITLHQAGDFWVTNAGAGNVAINMKAYANNATGAISFAATGTPTAGATSTASTIALNNGTTSTIAQNSFTASIAGLVMTVSAVATGALAPNELITGTGVAVGTTIVNQLTGTKGAAGTYTVSINQTALSFANGATPGYSTMTVAGTVTGFFDPAGGQTITGGTTSAGTTILSGISGVGGAGTYAVTIAQTVASASLTASGGLLTVAGTLTGSFQLNNLLAGGGVNAGTYITKTNAQQPLLTGTGGAGTYLLNQGQTLGAAAVGSNSNTETKWYAMSVGGPGELIKMSSWPLG